MRYVASPMAFTELGEFEFGVALQCPIVPEAHTFD